MKQLLCICVIILFYSCSAHDKKNIAGIKRHRYLGVNDSIEQTLEIFSMDDSTALFTLRVENKYLDSLDGYMSNAVSKDHVHYIHERNNCRIEFNVTGKLKDTSVITFCQCPELTLSPSATIMLIDTIQMKVYR